MVEDWSVKYLFLCANKVPPLAIWQHQSRVYSEVFFYCNNSFCNSCLVCYKQSHLPFIIFTNYSWFFCSTHPTIQISHLIFWVLKWLARFGTKILSLLINPCHLAPKYFEHFTGSAPPLFILDPLLWIGSAYVSVYINSCFGLNELLTNLTLLRQHHLQYTGGLAEIQGLLLPSLYCDALHRYSSDTYRLILFFSELL